MKKKEPQQWTKCNLSETSEMFLAHFLSKLLEHDVMCLDDKTCKKEHVILPTELFTMAYPRITKAKPEHITRIMQALEFLGHVLIEDTYTPKEDIHLKGKTYKRLTSIFIESALWFDKKDMIRKYSFLVHKEPLRYLQDNGSDLELLFRLRKLAYVLPRKDKKQHPFT